VVVSGSAAIQAGGTAQYTAVVADENGTAITSNVVWSILQTVPEVSISATGMVSVGSGVPAGTSFIVLAIQDGAAGYANVTVNEALVSGLLGEFMTSEGPAGTELNPFLIYSAEDLMRLGTGENGWTEESYYKLMADITVNNDMYPLPGSQANHFNGTLDGNGRTLNMQVSKDLGVAPGGLLRYIGTEGVIKNLNFSGKIELNSAAGASLAFGNYGTITNCHVSAVITDTSGSDNLYGFAGLVTGNYNTGAISGCSMSGDVNAYCAGGLVGFNAGVLMDSYVTGNINGVSTVGGLATRNAGTVTDCFFEGSITGNNIVGGIAGQNQNGGIISKCYVSGNITGTDGSRAIGGIAGENSGSVIENCRYKGDITAPGDCTGGIAGLIYNSSRISNCLFLGSIKGSEAGSANIGGIAGGAYNDDGGLNHISNCVANGSIVNGTTHLRIVDGPLSGYDAVFELYNNYAVMPLTEGVEDLNGHNGATLQSAALIDTFFSNPANWYGDTGWDFTDTWLWDSTVSEPLLR
jgi:hypothetical protein